MGPIRRALPLWLAAAATWTAAWLIASPPTAAVEQNRLDLALRLGEHGQLVLAPQAPGFELLIAPAAVIGGETLVRLWLIALTACAVPLAVALGRELVPDPWPLRGGLALIAAAPMVAAASAISPGGVGAACLTAGVLLAVRARQRPRLMTAAGGATAIGVMPWLAIKLAIPATIAALTLWRWLRRDRQRLAGFVALEIVVFLAVLYATLSDRLFGTLTPSTLAAGGATGADGVLEHLARAPRLVTVLLDPSIGALVWWPPLALVGVAAAILVRSRRERLGRALPRQAEIEATAAFLLVIAASVWLTAAFLAPSLGVEDRPWSRGRQLVPAFPIAAALGAWAWRRLPRTGAALAIAGGALSLLMVAGVF